MAESPEPEPEAEPEPAKHERAPGEPAPREKPPARERFRRWRERHPRGTVALVVLLVLLLIGAVIVWWYVATFESTDDAQVDAHISPISVRVAGTVVAVHVENNQLVKAGQLLVELDPRDHETAVARAEAELAQARALLAAEHPNVPITTTTNVTQIATSEEEVAAARAAVAAAERDQQSAEARLVAAEANDVRARADEKRYHFLLGQRAVPRERYDQVLAAARTSRAEVASARALARASRKVVDEQRRRFAQAEHRAAEASQNAPEQLTIRRSTIDARAAAVRAAEAALAQARLNLGYTRVTAPIDGVIGQRSVEPGQRVQPGEQLLSIVDLGHVWVTANFKETQLHKLRVGQPVRVSLDAYGTKYDGTIESFAGATGARYSLLPPENATGNYVKVVQRLPVRIRIDPGQDPERRLRPGLSVEPRVRVR